MKILDIIKQANSNLARAKIRSILTILAIFVGSFTIILNIAINTGVHSFIDKQLESTGGDGYLEIIPSSYREMMESMTKNQSKPVEYDPSKKMSGLSTISKETLQDIAKIEGVKAGSVKPLFNSAAEYIDSQFSEKKYKISLNILPTNNINIDMLHGRSVDTESQIPEIALIEGYAEILGFESEEAIVGKEIILAVKNRVNEEILTTTAIVSGVQAPNFISMGQSWTNEALDEKLHELTTAGLPKEYAEQSLFAIAEYDPSIPKSELERIKNDFAELQLSAYTIGDQVGIIRIFFDAILIIFTVFGAIALLAASIGITNTLLMSVSDRTREIGLMKAMGLSNIKVFLSFAFEAIILGFWSSCFGSIAAVIIGYSVNAAFHAEGGFLEAFPTFSLVKFTPANIIVIGLVIMFIAFIAGTLPAIRAARKNPIEALRYE